MPRAGGVAGQGAAEGGAGGDRVSGPSRCHGGAGGVAVRRPHLPKFGRGARGVAGAGGSSRCRRRARAQRATARGPCRRARRGGDLGADDDVQEACRVVARVPSPGGQRRLPGGLHGGVPGGAGGDVAVTGPPVFGGRRRRRSGRGGRRRSGPCGRTRAGAMPTGRRPRRRGQRQTTGDLAEGVCRTNRGGGPDEGQDHVARRADSR